MRQNARQIMNIVGGTFPKISFHDSSDESICLQTQYDGEALGCLWMKVTSLSSSTPEDTVETLVALTEVGVKVKPSPVRR